MNKSGAPVVLGAAALALLLGVTPAGAQAPDARAPQDMNAAVDQALATFPVTPERRELGRRLVASLDGPAKLHAFGEMGVLMAKKQFADQLKSAPAAKLAVAEKAYLDALSEAQARYETRAIDHMVDYYAGHLSSDDMAVATAFYASPLGARIVHADPPPTEEERQQIGQAMVGTPALQRFTAVQFAMAKDQQAVLPQEQAMLIAETRAGFCRRLVTEHFKSPACTTSIQTTAAR
jgi:hypothetical protein